MRNKFKETKFLSNIETGGDRGAEHHDAGGAAGVSVEDGHECDDEQSVQEATGMPTQSTSWLSQQAEDEVVAEEAFFDGLEAQEAEESDQDWFTDWSEYFAVKSRTTTGPTISIQALFQMISKL
jgi:hypothetical protein